ncbi:MAG: hypothetical protein RL591_1805 [Planctomycetota bacterium]
MSGRRCGGSLWRALRQSEQVAKQVASAQTRGGRSNYGCPMSRGVNEVNTESHRNRGLSNFHAWKSPRPYVIRSDGWLAHVVRLPDIGHPCRFCRIHTTASKSGGREPKVRPAASCERSKSSRSPLRRLTCVQSTPQRAKAADANRRFAPPQVASAEKVFASVQSTSGTCAGIFPPFERSKCWMCFSVSPTR